MNDRFADAVAAALTELERDRILPRLWQRDVTVWRPDPREIADRLGWLDLPRTMRGQLPRLKELAHDARRAGLDQIVLLGMGGSSLGSEVLASVFGSGPGYPRLAVLDSTVPEWVRRVRTALDPERALFLVASKSGSTAEVDALFRYFWAETEARVGAGAAGSHFLAISDPGTSLAGLARDRGFRACLENPPDLGGRFSVLSLFGLVPAALLGIDLVRFLGWAGAMAEACGPGVPLAENPGALLGAQLGAAARLGRYQATILASPRLATFGLWAEQLLAESTGKEGRGILPITDEPMVEAELYGSGRLFVALRLEGDANRELDRSCAALAAAGHPVVRLDLAAAERLGGELFRWEMATAVAGHLLGIQPFDQPNVEETKVATRRLLDAWKATGKLPAVAAADDLSAALAVGEPPSYVALLAFLDESPALAAACRELRRRLLVGRGLATTFGYGPRYLHSTGQLHKGGPAGGLYVQLVGRDYAKLPIPDQAFDFATLARAQADGDLAALAARGRRCVRLALGADPAGEVAALAQRLGA